MLKLIIGNKNYSSWSFRPWLALKVKDIAFEEELRLFDIENNFKDYFEFSPTGRVPVLEADGQTLWESLAILEYLADLHPDALLWPLDIRERAEARCLAHEVHTGFTAIKTHCAMNMRRPVQVMEKTEAMQKDVSRIEAIWEACLAKSDGPFLLGEFSNLDAMFAPIVNRLQVYGLSDHPVVTTYTDTMTALPAWKEWAEASKDEVAVAKYDEV